MLQKIKVIESALLGGIESVINYLCISLNFAPKYHYRCDFRCKEKTYFLTVQMNVFQRVNDKNQMFSHLLLSLVIISCDERLFNFIEY